MSELFISDLDGTLLGADAKLSELSRLELTALLHEGLAFTVATARALPSIRAILAGVPLTLPVIELNGALVTDLQSGRHLHAHPLAAQSATDILHTFTALGLSPFIATAYAHGVHLHYGDRANEGMVWFHQEKVEKEDPRLCLTDDLRAALAGDVLGFTILDRAEVVQAARAALVEAGGGAVQTHCFAHPYCPGFWELSAHAPTATKANAIAALRALTEERFTRVTVFGDNVNDMDMFEVADHAVAVSNAVPELLQRAHQVIPSHEENGVVRFLRERWEAGRAL